MIKRIMLILRTIDKDKIKGYLNELEDASLIKRDQRNVYLKRIADIF